jgi:hypothetical protein
LIILFTILNQRDQAYHLRPITSFYRFKRVVEMAVESGSRLHLSLGRGKLSEASSAVSFIGLKVLRRLIHLASISDNPPVVTSGDGVLNLLSQSTQRSTLDEINVSELYDPLSCQLTGITPFSYAVGTLPLILDEEVSANVLIGNFGSEIALATDAAVRKGSTALAGTDSLVGQSVLYATANQPLIGEEVFAGGAYINEKPEHIASLRAEDVIRWIIVVTIFVGIALKLLNLDTRIFNFLSGLL